MPVIASVFRIEKCAYSTSLHLRTLFSPLHPSPNHVDKHFFKIPRNACLHYSIRVITKRNLLKFTSKTKNQATLQYGS